jgi:hypothetical protein
MKTVRVVTQASERTMLYGRKRKFASGLKEAPL